MVPRNLGLHRLGYRQDRSPQATVPLVAAPRLLCVTNESTDWSSFATFRKPVKHINVTGLFQTALNTFASGQAGGEGSQSEQKS